jgi:WD40 repeat protein
VRLWDAATGQPSGEPLRDPAITRADGLAFAPDGLSLVHGAGNAVAIWDLATRRARLIPVSTTQFVRAVAHVRNGATVAMGCGDGRVLLHDVATGVTTPVLGAHAREVFDLTFSPDGRYLASCGTDAIVKLWDVVSREEVLALAGGDGPLHGVAFDPGGHRLAAASHLGPIRLWRGDSREASARVDR